MEEIINQLEISIKDIENKPISEKFKLIENKNNIITNNLNYLKKIEKEILDYQPNSIEINDLNYTFEEIENGVNTIKVLDLESSLEIYKDLINKINGIENFIKIKAEEYSVV